MKLKSGSNIESMNITADMDCVTGSDSGEIVATVIITKKLALFGGDGSQNWLMVAIQSRSCQQHTLNCILFFECLGIITNKTVRNKIYLGRYEIKKMSIFTFV